MAVMPMVGEFGHRVGIEQRPEQPMTTWPSRRSFDSAGWGLCIRRITSDCE